MMESLTCVIDASTLVDRIHEVKEWIYYDSIRILIPACTLEKVGQICKEALAAVEVAKESANKRPLNKAARREQPLFDINPRITTELLQRAKIGEEISTIAFQGVEEQFTQWKDEDRQVVAAAQPPVGPPTSFAQALLRKLNISDGSDINGPKGPAKPRLVARSTSPKSPWKYHKVPSIPSSGVPEAMKSILSYVLWRLHEYENNPLMPETLVLLTNNGDLSDAAKQLNIPIKNICDLRRDILEKKSTQKLCTDLESDILSKDAKEGLAEVVNSCVNGNDAHSNGSINIGVEALTVQVELIEGSEGTKAQDSVIGTGIEGDTAIIGVKEPETSDDTAKHQETSLKLNGRTEDSEALLNSINGISDSEEKQVALKTQSQSGALDDVIPIPPNISKASNTPYIPHIPGQSPSNTTQQVTGQKHELVVPAEEESDDEEVVVFKPKSRRSSAPRKQPIGSERPTTASSVENEKMQKFLQVENGSVWKSESPVFVPIHIQTLSPPEKPIHNDKLDNGEHFVCLEKEQAQPNLQHHKRAPFSNGHRNDGFAQRQSRDIIQRQRNAIQRQAQVSPKPPPRQIQMQPSASPTVIDPDAFDRSYVVQTPTSATNGGNQYHRSNPRGSPRRAPKSPTPEVDYVLKSGSPRASTRGKGKLWVP